MDKWPVLQGTALAVNVTLRDATGAVITTYTGSETLAATLWPSGSVPALLTPSVAWVTPSIGLIQVSLTAAQSAQLAAGRYELAVTLTASGVTSGVYEASIIVEAQATAGTAFPTYGGPAIGPAALSQVYCTDEDMLIRAAQDFTNLCPRSQTLAAGADGSFTAGAPWVLTSTVTNFVNAGVAPGNIVVLTAPKSQYQTSGGWLLAVASVSNMSVTLRRPGLLAGVGLPPAPAAGLAGVVFSVPYYGPQIDNASYDANKFFGIDINSPMKSPDKLYDARELQQFVVLTVLRRLYIAAEKTATGDYKLKLADVSCELEELKSRLQVHWGTTSQGSQPASSLFAARMRR